MRTLIAITLLLFLWTTNIVIVTATSDYNQHEESWTRILRRKNQDRPGIQREDEPQPFQRFTPSTPSTPGRASRPGEGSITRTNHSTTGPSTMSLAQALELLLNEYDTGLSTSTSRSTSASTTSTSTEFKNNNSHDQKKSRRRRRRWRIRQSKKRINIQNDDPSNNLRKRQERLGRGRRLARIETDDDDNFNLGKIQQKHLKVPGNESDKDSNDDDDECGPDCRNLLHELGHPREQSRCSGSGQVIDIWGYCRDIFHEERRDWDWWSNLRVFVQSQGNSWYSFITV